MRILMISDRYPPEVRSVAHLFQELAEGLAKLQHEVTVLTKMPTEYLPNDTGEGYAALPALAEVNGVQIIRLHGLFTFRTAILLRAVDQLYLGLRILWRAICLPRYDVVIVYSPPLPLTVTAALYGKWHQVPYVLHLHDLYPRTAVELGVLKNKILIWGARQLERFAYKSASHIVVPAPGSQQFLTEEKHIPAEKVHLIPNWVDTSIVHTGPKHNSFRKKHALDSMFVISYAGLMGFAQDLTTIIQCAHIMRTQKDIVFLLVGDGVYAERWKELASGLENVRFFPPVSKELYYDILRASDACLMPLTATLESPAIPGKLQSIMAAGRPVIAVVPLGSNAAQVVQESGCGFVVSPGEPEELRRVLNLLYSDPALGERLGREGRKYAEQYFDLHMAVSRFHAVLTQVVQVKLHD
jgi:colanic acid biosynthesis glycosyl transferase WcaI